MDEDEYTGLDGLGLAERVRTGQVTARDLLEIALERADRLDPRLNAIPVRLDARAREQAAGRLAGPFAGVPFLLKDLHQDLEGMPTSAGSRSLAETPAIATSTIVQRWLDAGLVVFGKTSTPEFGAKGVTEPELSGPTRNPWDPDRTPGGSSGGSAAAVASPTRGLVSPSRIPARVGVGHALCRAHPRAPCGAHLPCGVVEGDR